MTKEMNRSLGLDRIFALLEASGELMEHARGTGLNQGSNDIATLSKDGIRIKEMMEALSARRGLRSALRDVFQHLGLPLLPSPEAGYDQHQFFELKCFIHYYRELLRLLDQQLRHYNFPDLDKLYGLLDPEGQQLPVFRISPSYSARLQELDARQTESRNRLRNSREQDLALARKALDEPSLKTEFVLSRRQTELIAKLQQSPFFLQSGENIANLTFKLADSEQSSALMQRLSLLLEEKREEEQLVLEQLKAELIKHLAQLEQALAETKKLSWDFLRADFGLNYSCVIPELVSEPVIRIKGAVNLPLKEHLEEQGRSFQGLDLVFEDKISLITGANMGGKTTVLKTLGQLVQLARLGIPLPAQEAVLGLPEEVWINHDDSKQTDNLSSFGREVVAFTEILQSGKTCLLLLDEFAKGTNPKEGEALCSAVLRYLAGTKHSCVAATHYTAPSQLPELAQYSMAGLDAEALQGISAGIDTPLKERLKLLSKAMDYRLIRLETRQAPPPAAVKIARALGLPEAILQYLKTEETHA